MTIHCRLISNAPVCQRLESTNLNKLRPQLCILIRTELSERKGTSEEFPSGGIITLKWVEETALC